jgi:PAS domain-containing protein
MWGLASAKYQSIVNYQPFFPADKTNQNGLRENNRHMQEVLASLEQRISERTSEITQQKQFFEALVQNSPIAIVTLNNEHCILSCNPAF